MITDPVSDMLTRIRNAGMARHESVDIPASRLKLRIAQILKDEGYIRDFHEVEQKPQSKLVVDLKYGPDQKLTIRGLRRISKPGRRRYTGSKNIPNVLNGLGVVIISTPQGVITDRKARKLGIGGEVLCEVW